MKLFDCDWSSIAAAAARWDVLPIPCKMLFLKHADPVRPLEVSRIRADFQPLVRGGFLETSLDGTHLMLPASQQAFLRVVRAMSRHEVFQPGYEKSIGLAGYLKEHFTQDEIYGLAGGAAYWGSDLTELATEASLRAWVDEFLSETDVRKWTKAHSAPGTRAVMPDSRTFDLAQGVLRALMRESPYLTFPELAAHLGARDLNAYGGAIRTLIHCAMVFPALVGPALHIGIGLWPAIHRRIHRVAPAPPAGVTPARKFCAPFLADDMTLLLVACATQPLRLRKDNGLLFSKIADDLGTRLSSMPDWLVPVLKVSPADRLRVAQGALAALGMTRVPRASRQQPALEATAEGARWIRGSDGERLKHILAILRKDLDDAWDPFEDTAWSPHPRVPFADTAPSVQCEREPYDWRSDLVSAFAGLPEGGHVRLGEFLEFQSSERNPFVRLLREGRKMARLRMWRNGRIGEEELEATWREVLDRFLTNRLLPFGCAEIGVADDGKTTIGLTAPGRYLLGQAQGFDLGAPAGQDILVQPNLEIVFLAHSPSAETTASRLAERVGHGVGVLFRITRRSVHGAFAAGWKPEEILAALGGLSRKPIPGNVAHQVRDWAAQCRRVEIGSAILFRCPDAETALRVLAAGGKKLERISDTVVALTDRKALPHIERKLRAEGITRTIAADKEDE